MRRTGTSSRSVDALTSPVGCGGNVPGAVTALCATAGRVRLCVPRRLVTVYSGRCFVVLDIDTTAKPATVTYEVWLFSRK